MKNQLNGIQSNSLHDTVDDKQVTVQYNDTQQNKYGLSASLGLGYVLPIKQQFFLSLSANYDVALTDNYVNNTFQHKIDNLSFGLSLIKAIGK